MEKIIRFSGDDYAISVEPVSAVIMGVGNPDSPFDSLGPLAALETERLAGAELGELAIFIDGGNSPESCTGKIKKARPSQIFILDSANFGGADYETRLIPPDKISGLRFSGHNLPLSMIYKYLKAETGADIFIIGIQIPKACEVGSICAGVASAAAGFSSLLKELFRIGDK